MSLSAKQANMKNRHSGAVSDVTLRRKERMSRPEPERVGPKTRCDLMREGLETRVRELKGELDRFQERKREQRERRYVVPITIVSSDELDRL